MGNRREEQLLVHIPKEDYGRNISLNAHEF